ncbi:MAG: excinuclease ABC subunit UvrA [Spirochaetaceae bacterium]|nr:MAG: excinuclease ABC subunit UvrA [Spirochaetaceae bacterium]
MKSIIVKGAREHNLKNIDLELPRDSLIVVSGISGSGKSSLAFDTIFAEGQRRYVESLSAYARQFLGRLDKPDLDYIEGLSPAISIEQKSTARNPRSTVGTVTEIYDYLRLLFARVGTPHCPQCAREISEQSVDQIVDTILALPDQTRIVLMAPVVRGRKGEHQKIIEDARRAGFVRMRVDGEILSLDEPIVLDKNRKHDLEIVVDRLIIKQDVRKRLADSVETALEVSSGLLIVSVKTQEGRREELYSQALACPICGISLPDLQPRLFSFNSPFGACPECSGLGVTLEFDPQLVIPDFRLSIREGAIATHNPKANTYRSIFASLARHYSFSLDTPLAQLPRKILDLLLYGSKEQIRFKYENPQREGLWEYTSNFRGVLNELKRRYLETSSEGVKEWLESFMSQRECPQCGGKRLRPESLAVTVGDRNIHETTCLSVSMAQQFFSKLKLKPNQQTIARQILKEISARLKFMADVGLDYLTLERRAYTLSGGEAQRIRLATQIGSSLVGVLYILDEPTIGLHQRDNHRLLETLLHLRDLGNTLIVVEHDEQTLRSADYIVDLGPGAGVHGGQVVFAGAYEDILNHDKSLTGKFLSGRVTIDTPRTRRFGSGKAITLIGAAEHNLKKINVSFPLGKLTVITGVSGSGKSSLLTDLLYPVLANRVNRAHLPVGSYQSVEGVEAIDKVINIDQSPIGRTPRSNPATYVGVFTPIRELFASLPESKAMGYKPGRFSFNVRSGRCENCQGAGTIKIEMHFLPDVYITCDVCRGKRFNRETLEILYKGKNIDDVLDMTVDEAYTFFRKIPVIERKLKMLIEVGLGYIQLGQSAITLSGGEAQRVKLSLELSRRSTGRTFYILDEPTTGLHFADVKQLLDVLNRLVDNGNTVVLIEHNLDVIKQADYLIDLGPEGGDRGGEIIVTGAPEDVAACGSSYTGQYLQAILAGQPLAEPMPDQGRAKAFSLKGQSA